MYLPFGTSYFHRVAKMRHIGSSAQLAAQLVGQGQRSINFTMGYKKGLGRGLHAAVPSHKLLLISMSGKSLHIVYLGANTDGFTHNLYFFSAIDNLATQRALCLEASENHAAFLAP